MAVPGTIAILPDDKTPWLSIRQFQVKYGVAENTVRSYIARGLVQSILLPQKGVTAYRVKDPGWKVDGPMESLDHTFTVDDLIMLRPCEVADLLGVTERWVQEMARRGKLKYYALNIGSAARRYPLSSVRALITMKATGGDKRPKRTAIRKAMVDLARARLQADL